MSTYDDKIKNNSTPSSINELVYNLLDVKSDDKILDIGSGVGSFLKLASSKSTSNVLYGIDKDRISVELSKELLSLSSSKYEIVNDDAFNDDILLSGKDKYDKIFSNFTFGIRDRELYNSLKKGDLPLEPRNTSDYYFINLLYRSLKSDGRGIIITSGSPLYNRIDNDIRKYLVDNGMIEAIYELPNNLYYNTAIPVYLMVLSFDNKNIKFASFKSYYNEVSRSLKELDVNSILDNINRETKVVGLKDVRDEEYILTPELYLSEKIALESSVTLGEISEIYSGWQITKKGLDERIDEDGNGYIIQLSDLGEYKLNLEDKYNIENTYIDRYKLQDGDILITAKSPKVDLVVIETKDETIVPTGSFIVVRVNELYDPHYILSFLKSNVGEDIIKLNQTGTVIKNLTVTGVKNIIIPKVDLRTQKEIGLKYQNKVRELLSLKYRIETIESTIKFNEDFKDI